MQNPVRSLPVSRPFQPLSPSKCIETQGAGTPSKLTPYLTAKTRERNKVIDVAKELSYIINRSVGVDNIRIFGRNNIVHPQNVMPSVFMMHNNQQIEVYIGNPYGILYWVYTRGIIHAVREREGLL
jgi:hypothetical protein